MNIRFLGIARNVRGVCCEEHGVASLEYAALLGLIILGVVATLGALGHNVSASTASMSQDLAGDTGIVYVEPGGSGGTHP